MSHLYAEITAAAEQSAYTAAIAHALYIIAAVLFVLSIKWLSAPHTARRGNTAGEIGMAMAIVGALLQHEIVGYQWILIGFVVGTLAGAPMAIWMKMTAVPQRTALSHAFGALAAALVGTAHYSLFFRDHSLPSHAVMAFLCLEVLLGGLTFTGSLMAFGKLQEILPTRPMTYKNQNIFNLSILFLAVVCGVILVVNPAIWWVFPILLVLAVAFGVLLILPIGGADMPTVIALL